MSNTVFVSTWFCDICQIETGEDIAGSIWCECDQYHTTHPSNLPNLSDPHATLTT